MRKMLSVAAAIGALAIGNPALAQDRVWFDSDHTSYSGYYANGLPLDFSGSGVNVRASAWSIHDDGNIYKAQLGVWPNGLGVLNGSGDNSHTVDNSGYLDFLLFQFDQVVELDKARFYTGWHGMYDTDATIGYLTAPISYTTPLPLDGAPQSILSALNLYGSGGIGNSGDSYRDINPHSNVGNIWLIGASFNNPEEPRKLDGFKLEKLTFSTVSAVPEPSTWTMMFVGFFALGGLLRSRRGSQKATVTYA
jgi:hypothetical protein